MEIEPKLFYNVCQIVWQFTFCLCSLLTFCPPIFYSFFSQFTTVDVLGIMHQHIFAVPCDRRSFRVLTTSLLQRHNSSLSQAMKY